MNLTKTRQLSADLLKLLKQVYEQNGASNLEKDLLKENLRELYKAIDESEVEENKNSNGYHKEVETPQTQAPEIKESISSPEAVQELIQEIRTEAIRTAEQPIISSFTFLDEQPEEIEEEEEMEEPILLQEDEKEIYTAPEPEPLITQVEKEIPQIQEYKTEPISVPEPTPDPVQIAREAEPVYQQPTPEPARSGFYMSSETEELFTTKIAKELSDKLSQSHLPDLHKAFGLNDRLLTISELFGGDPAAFKESMDTLNTYSHFDQAKRYLAENVIDKYRWTQPGKKDSARHLIQLIRRKYL
ncbi:MAG: hypothetical protein IPI60_17310 [Saprospiraceae bacterium]|nr:hypothetical protein [Saprospiraceae bacterium]